MSQKSTILKGAFILTLTGFATRIMGFFYKIFLSRNLGEENIGLYQLIFPIYALGFSLACAGIETAISRSVASKTILGKKQEANTILYLGTCISGILSLAILFGIQRYAGLIANVILNEPRCEPLLIILSYAFPFASVHSCICGYYLGLKQTKVPAISQLIEQAIRISAVYTFFFLFTAQSYTPGISLAVAGLIAGELASASYCIWKFKRQTKIGTGKKVFSWKMLFSSSKELLSMSIPLTANRILLNILQSIEAVSIPIQLKKFGLNTTQSLSMYGVLTGMALPCILFPSAATNSIASMLLPTIAELQTSGQTKPMVQVVKKTCCLCLLLGSGCCVCLLLCGHFIGEYIFHSSMAGDFIVTLAWICPFLYTNSTLISMINGLGKINQSFLFNAISLTIRILSVFLGIPFLGIKGYLWGLLASQLVLFILSLGFLLRKIS